jgi:hypothetical protein
MTVVGQPIAAQRSDHAPGLGGGNFIQLVANPYSRTGRPVRLLRELIWSGELDPASITRREETTLRTWARAADRRAVETMTALVRRGKRSEAKQHQRAYLKDMGAGLHALLRRLPSHLRHIHTAPSEEQDARRAQRWTAIVQNIPHVRDFSRPARPRLRCQPKPRGGTREIMSFTWLDQARMRLIDRAITPFVDLHPAQFVLRAHRHERGREGACAALLQVMRGQPADYGLIKVDVSNFFPSISQEWVEANLPLPKHITRTFVHAGGMLFRYGSSVVSPEMARPGLPQGSAVAPRVAEWVMAHVLQAFTTRLPHVLVVAYCDDMAILCRRDEASTIVNALREVLSTCEAGPFEATFRRPRRSIWSPLNRETEFLGYNFVVRRGTPSAYLAKAKVRGIRRRVAAMTSSPRSDFSRARQYVVGVCTSHRLWSGAAALCAELLALIDTFDRTRAELLSADPVEFSMALLRRVGRARTECSTEDDLRLLMAVCPRPRWREWRGVPALTPATQASVQTWRRAA